VLGIREQKLTLKRLNYFYVIYKNSDRTSQETHYVSATKPNKLMLFKETGAVYCENHTEHTNTLCGQTEEIISVFKRVVHILTTRL
jgi:hypothetical protein